MEEVIHIYGHTYVSLIAVLMFGLFTSKLICLNFHAFESKVTSVFL